MTLDVQPQVVPNHLNSIGCYIQHIPAKGRGVFASRRTAAHTTIEISPVLIFDKTEYQTYGKHTILDHYTFTWRDGRHALALGLGSLFNHSRTPNVSYTRDYDTESIRYTTARVIEPGEELCIFYGTYLWFDAVNSMQGDDMDIAQGSEDDEWERLCNIVSGEEDEIVPEEKLPFHVLKLKDDDPEEEIESVRTMDAWVLDVPDPRHTSTVLKWIKQCKLEHPSLDHLKRVRKHHTTTTVLLSATDLHKHPPSPPPDIDFAPAYTVSVPSQPALTLKSLEIKSTLWPTIFTPPRKNEPKIWTRAQLKWAHDAMHFAVAEAIKAYENGQHPIAACIPEQFEADTPTKISFIAHDTRNSTFHPLRHSILNLTREVGEAQYTTPADSTGAVRNGTNYLLTSHTVFTTHEPCLMCSMALLHSRVSQVVYLIPMKQTGGCGGVACLPQLESVNHRFGIMKWKNGRRSLSLLDGDWEKLQVEEFVDA